MKIERELFEAAIKKLGKIDSYTFDKHEDGSYKFDMIHFGWEIWQASANRQGYKLVPVEPTEEMYLAGTQELLSIDLSDIYDTDSVQIYKAMIGAVG